MLFEFPILRLVMCTKRRNVCKQERWKMGRRRGKCVADEGWMLSIGKYREKWSCKHCNCFCWIRPYVTHFEDLENRRRFINFYVQLLSHFCLSRLLFSQLTASRYPVNKDLRNSFLESQEHPACHERAAKPNDVNKNNQVEIRACFPERTQWNCVTRDCSAGGNGWHDFSTIFPMSVGIARAVCRCVRMGSVQWKFVIMELQILVFGAELDSIIL